MLNHSTQLEVFPDPGQVVVVVMGKEVGQKALLEKPLTIYVDGPFGSPSSNIYRLVNTSVVEPPPFWLSLQ